ncbi:ATP-binding protein [Nocardioides sp.]|uniref:ATP-binding protein n=1 Tax=Nocardioides sp. TaxID=35761 RepID=UPI0035AF9768
MDEISRLTRDLQLLEDLVDDQLASHLGTASGAVRSPNDRGFDLDLFSALHYGEPLTPAEHVVLLLALVPHLRPAFFDALIGRHLPEGGDLPELGGVRLDSGRGVLATGETAQFVIAGDDIRDRLAVQRMFTTEHWFSRRHLLWLDRVREGAPATSGRLVLDPESVELMTTGHATLPGFSTGFPAEHVGTEMDRDDVVLRPDTWRQIRDIETWMRFNDTVLHEWGMGKRVRPGYRVLFHGPPGTGKTLAATLIGKATGRPVFRVDLSRVVSKYIGETEKNLSGLFDKAEGKEWILFFDEADALFGKRTDIRDAHDKYANQEASYLLQRIETFSGLVILATNRRSNIDEAFLRRFQSAVCFHPPTPEQRRELWQRSFPHQVAVDADVDWRDIAGRFELTAASIVNVAHHCAIAALDTDMQPVDRSMLEGAIMQELVKDGKVV